MNGLSSNAAPTAGETQRRAKFELGVSLALSTWPALTLAVQNQWGGPDSSDKRDWFAGAIVDLFPTHSDISDIEERLLQIMEDEFEVVPDDESVGQVADLILLVWTETQTGEFGTVDRLLERWKSGAGKSVRGVRGGGESDDGDLSVDEESDDDIDDDGDEEMGDAPALVAVKEKAVPEVDEEGFTKVVAKKKR